ncbi:MAG: hypothetical protein WD266_06000 [Balneolales bacterium]
MDYTITPVDSADKIETFHQLPFRIYEDFPKWAPPLRFEIENIFNAQTNNFFRDGECERFIVYSGDRAAGRFAVMNNPAKDCRLSPAMGGMGFIEMEDDKKLAGEIIRFAKDWHGQKGYAAMRGPINFGENDNHWGLLVNNFDDPPVYGMQYHAPYYQNLLELTGAEKLDDQYSFTMEFQNELPERLIRITDRILRNKAITYRPINMKKLYEDAELIKEIYNRAWAEQDIAERESDFTPLTTESVRKMVDDLKRVMIQEAILLAFVNGEPASFIVSVPDLYELSKQTGGKIRWWHIPRMLRFKRHATRLRNIALGTVPKYRKLGLEALLFVKGVQGTRDNNPSLKRLEGAWISEKNWLMRRSVEALGCRHHKTHRTYKWEFSNP